jgi:polysaccharide chain length determinant protein (PEP-CTERM system associated)
MLESLHEILTEARSAWRFRWVGLSVAWAIAAIGWTYVMLMPNVYEASSRVYVDPSSVLRPLLDRQIVASDITTRLSYVREALLGAEYMQRIASANGLDQRARNAAQREQVLANLKESITIAAEPATADRPQRDDAMVLRFSYRHQSRATAVSVVDMLLAILINDTLGADEAGASTAESFLNERIREYEARLQSAERALADFRRTNSGRLPGAEGSYFQAIQNERDKIEETRLQMRLAESRRDQLRAHSLDARIREHRAELDRLSLEFTDRHPDVIAEREALVRLEEQRSLQLRGRRVSNPDQEVFSLASNPVFEALQIDLNKAEVEITTLAAQVRDGESRLAQLQAVIDEAPEVEAQLAQLNREYDVVRDQYQKLIQTREIQNLSEKASDTEQVAFRILNPPMAGTEPAYPPRLSFLAAALMVAVAAGGGVCLVLARLKPVFGTGSELREISGVPLLGVIGQATPSPSARSRRIASLAWFLSGASALIVLFLVIAAAEAMFGAASGAP